MPVSVTEKASTVGARLRSSLSEFQPACAGSTRQRHLAVVRELEGVGEQVLETCCRRLASVNIDLRQVAGRSWIVEVDVLGLGHVAEGALDVVVQVVQAQFADVHDDRARLDLGQVENVVDEHQQVVAGRVDRLGELHLLAASGCRRGSCDS